MKKQNGITLIALIITIVILLILAGISISLVAGEDGVLKKAMNATKATKEAAAIEQVSLSWASCKVVYLTNGKRISREECFSKENLNNNLANGEIISVSIGVDEVGTSELIYKEKNDYYKMQMTAGGELSIIGTPSTTLPTIKEPINKNDTTNLLEKVKANPSEWYGKKISGYTANGVSDWRIFYADNENVFIIASDCIPASKACASNSAIKSNFGTYGIGWNPAPSSASSTSNVSKFSPVTGETMAWGGDYNNNYNARCISTLLDTNSWSAFVDSSKAEMAIGSPTLNMWVASWNTKYPSEKIYCNHSDSIGYFLGTSSNPGSTYLDEGVMAGFEGYTVAEADNMYYPHKNELAECAGYWFASTGIDPYGDGEYVLAVGFNSKLGHDYYFNFNYGSRPVVCLKSSINTPSNYTDNVIIITD